MQTLAEAVEAVSSKFKPALAAGSYELQLNKKAVDLNTPFRLLNVPAGSKLEIVRSEIYCLLMKQVGLSCKREIL
jgi:hypothetical protein